MSETNLEDHDWEAVYDALTDLLDHSEKNEPRAVNLHAAIQAVIDSLPTEDD